jgi:uncharacterized protein YlzI (FlbEa/FlbD family)
MNKIITLTKRNGDKVYLNTTNIVELITESTSYDDEKEYGISKVTKILTNSSGHLNDSRWVRESVDEIVKMINS